MAMDSSVTVHIGNVFDVLPILPPKSVQTVVTSPPYWNLRDYGHPDQIGSEPDPAQYIGNVTRVFSLLRDVLTDDGTVWLNLGTTYARRAYPSLSAKQKDDLCIPHRVYIALMADGWYGRMDTVWDKPNAMPEGSAANDRPTRSHEYVFLLGKTANYFYDPDPIREPFKTEGGMGWAREMKHQDQMKTAGDFKIPVSMAGLGMRSMRPNPKGRNRRSVWSIPTSRYKGAHFAVFPELLVEPCLLATSRPGDTVADLFAGSGTVGSVAKRLGRKAVLVELNPEYEPLIRRRTEDTL